MFDFSERKGLSRQLLRLYDACRDLWEGLPAGWDGQARGMLVAGAVTTNPGNVDAFLRSAAKELAQPAGALVRRWREAPWRYAIYAIVEDLGDDLLEVEEIEMGQGGGAVLAESPLTLYSPSSARYLREGRELFFSLLWWNGRCYQSYGPIVGFRSFTPDDLIYFTESILAVPRFALGGTHGETLGGRHPASADSGGGEPGRLLRAVPIARIMASDPIPYLALFRYSDTPPVVSRNEPLVRCEGWGDLPAEGFARAAEAAGTAGSAVEAGGKAIARAGRTEGVGRILLGEGDPLHDAVVYHDFRKGRLYVVAMSEAAYSRARGAFREVAALPERPQRRCSLTMHVAASQILGGEGDADRLAAACRSLDEKPGEEEVDEEELDLVNEVMDRLTSNRNEGRSETDEEIAEALGFEASFVSRVREQVEEMFARMDAAAPAAERLGLAPAAFHALTTGRIPNLPGVLRLRSLEEYSEDPRTAQLAERVPLVRGARWLLRTVRERGRLRATQAGNLPVAFVEEAHGSGELPVPEDEIEDAGLRAMFHPRREDEWPFLWDLHELLEQLDLLASDGRSFSTTKAGAEIAEDAVALHRILLESLFHEVEWDDRVGPLVLQNLAGFLLYASRRLSGSGETAGWLPTERITEVFLAAFPGVDRAAGAGEEQSGSSLLTNATIREGFFRRFAWRLGLVELRPAAGKLDPVRLEFRTSPFFDLLFE